MAGSTNNLGARLVGERAFEMMGHVSLEVGLVAGSGVLLTSHTRKQS